MNYLQDTPYSTWLLQLSKKLFALISVCDMIIDMDVMSVQSIDSGRQVSRREFPYAVQGKPGDDNNI
jgi:hypothetical protein